MTFDDICAMDTEALHLAIAIHCEGYADAGVFRGQRLMHPKGTRTTVEPLKDYTGSWDACMPLFWDARLSLAEWIDVETGHIAFYVEPQAAVLSEDRYPVATPGEARRRICEIALWQALSPCHTSPVSSMARAPHSPSG